MVCLPPPLLLPPPPLPLEHAASRPGTATTPAPTAAPRSTERRESWLGVSLDCVITPPTLFREWRVGWGIPTQPFKTHHSPAAGSSDVKGLGPLRFKSVT